MPFWITSFNQRTILQVAIFRCYLCKHYEQALFLTPLDGQRKEARGSRTLSFKFTTPQFFFNLLKQIHTIGNYKGVVKSSFLLEFNFYWRPPVQQSLTCMVFLCMHREQVLMKPFPLFTPLILSDFRSMPSDYLRPWRPPWAPLPGLPPPLPQPHPLLLGRQLRWFHQRS